MPDELDITDEVVESENQDPLTVIDSMVSAISLISDCDITNMSDKEQFISDCFLNLYYANAILKNELKQAYDLIPKPKKKKA